MKKLFTISSILVLAVCILMLAGCDKESSTPCPVCPGSESSTTTQIVANGSLAPTSRTQAQGTLLVANQSGSAVTGLTSQNVSVQLTWNTTNTVTGTVVIQSLSQSGKNIAVATTMDYSGSMYVGTQDPVTYQYQRITDMETGVKTFVNALKTNDICEIIKFDDVVQVFQPFTSSKQLLLHAVDSVPSLGGSTALFSSIVTGIRDVAGQSASSYARAVVAFTDGAENASYPITMDTLLQAARSNAIPVYTIGLLDSMYHSTPPGQNYSQERNLVQIADSTGGFYFYAPSASQLTQIYNSISGQLSNAYTVTITWPSTSLPVSGTQVTAVITVTYNGLTSVYRQTYTMP